MQPPALVARLGLALLCLSPLNTVHAAPTPGDTDLIRERQDRLLEEQRRRLEELKELPGKPVNRSKISIHNTHLLRGGYFPYVSISYLVSAF